MNNQGEGVKESYRKVINLEKTGRKDKRRGDKKSYGMGQKEKGEAEGE